MNEVRKLQGCYCFVLLPAFAVDDHLSAEFKSCVSKTVIILCNFPHLNTWKPGVLLCVRWIYELRKRAYCVSAEFTSSGNIRLFEITQQRKPCGNTCLSDAFPRCRNNGNLPYTRISCNGYLNFRLRKFTFPSDNRWENGNGSALFHPVYIKLNFRWSFLCGTMTEIDWNHAKLNAKDSGICLTYLFPHQSSLTNAWTHHSALD